MSMQEKQASRKNKRAKQATEPRHITRAATRIRLTDVNAGKLAVWWYRLSRQKWTNVERELSSMRKETWNDQVDRQKTAFCSLTTDDIAHNCKSGNSPRDHFLPLKPFDSL